MKTGFREADQRIDAGLQQLRRLAHGDIGRRRRGELGYSPAQARHDAGDNIGSPRRASIGKIERCLGLSPKRDRLQRQLSTVGSSDRDNCKRSLVAVIADRGLERGDATGAKSTSFVVVIESERNPGATQVHERPTQALSQIVERHGCNSAWKKDHRLCQKRWHIQ